MAFDVSGRTSGTAMPIAPTSNATDTTAPMTRSTTPPGAMTSPTTAKISPASITTCGGPSDTISGIASTQPSPAPIRSAKYSRPTRSPPRPRIVETMMPRPTNDAKSVKQSAPSIAMFLNEPFEP